MSLGINGGDDFLKRLGVNGVPPAQTGAVEEGTAAEGDVDTSIFDVAKEGSEGNESGTEYKYDIAAEEYLNEMLQLADVIAALDTDGDGAISSEEKNAFLKEIVGLDGDDSSISVEDIDSGLSAHGYGKTDETEEANKDEAVKEDDGFTLQDLANNLSQKMDELGEATMQAGAMQAQATQQAGAMGASAAMKAGEMQAQAIKDGFASLNDTLASDEIKANSLEGMSLKELKEEQDNRKAQLKTANSNLKEAENKYQEALQKEEQMTEELKAKQKENQDKIDDKQKEIKDTQDDIVDKEDDIRDKKSDISNIKNEISSLKSELNSVVIPPPVYDEDGNVTNQAEIDAAIQKKEDLQKQIEEKQEELEKAEEELEELQGELEELEDDLSLQEEELDILEQERTQIENEVMNSNCSEETKQALQNFNKADKNQYTAQNNVYEVNRKIAQES